jgi:hypothetical protein
MIAVTKGYNTANGYMGWLEDEKRYKLFSNESEYLNEVKYNEELRVLRAEYRKIKNKVRKSIITIKIGRDNYSRLYSRN